MIEDAVCAFYGVGRRSNIGKTTAPASAEAVLLLFPVVRRDIQTKQNTGLF